MSKAQLEDFGIVCMTCFFVTRGGIGSRVILRMGMEIHDIYLQR